MEKPYKRSLIPVVNKRFQYKYTAIIVCIAALISAAFGFFLLNSYWEMNRIMNLALETPDIGDQVHADEAIRVFYVAIMFIGFEILVLGGAGLLITHRLCGPVFVMHRQLTVLLEGRYPRPRPLRSGDEFESTFALLTQLVASLKARDMDETEKLAVVMENARRKGMSDSEVSLLRRLINERRARLGSAVEA